jgi:hypothetical protein
MTDKHPNQRGSDQPEFDPRRSAEIRSLLVRTVAGTRRPRPARLSRTAFALAASAALLFAGGIGAGAVVAYDRLTESTLAENAGAPTNANQTTTESLSTESADAAASGDAAADGEVRAATAGGLTPVLTLNGEIGYVYPADLEAARLGLLGFTADSIDPAESEAADGGLPIYRADGVTVLGYFDPAGLTP